eukprot:5488043-Amphidinium_carterae.1
MVMNLDSEFSRGAELCAELRANRHGWLVAHISKSGRTSQPHNKPNFMPRPPLDKQNDLTFETHVSDVF